MRIDRLTNDFIQGESAVDPKQLPYSCQYCDYSSVCRAHHQSVDAAVNHAGPNDD